MHDMAQLLGGPYDGAEYEFRGPAIELPDPGSGRWARYELKLLAGVYYGVYHRRQVHAADG